MLCGKVDAAGLTAFRVAEQFGISSRTRARTHAANERRKKPRLGDTPPGQYLMLAAFFAATCHVSMIGISMINLSTPRFLMAIYPQLLLSGLFLAMALVSPARRFWGRPEPLPGVVDRPEPA